MTFLKALGNVPRYCHLASCVPLMVLVCITTADVAARYIFASSVPDTAEISGMLLGICISLSLAFTTLRGEQVSFDLVVNRLPLRARMAADLITLLISAALFAVIAWQTVKRVLYSMKGGEYIGAMEIPIWPAKSIFALGCLLTALVLAAMFASAVRRVLDRRQ